MFSLLCWRLFPRNRTKRSWCVAAVAHGVFLCIVSFLICIKGTRATLGKWAVDSRCPGRYTWGLYYEAGFKVSQVTSGLTPGSLLSQVNHQVNFRGHHHWIKTWSLQQLLWWIIFQGEPASVWGRTKHFFSSVNDGTSRKNRRFRSLLCSIYFTHCRNTFRDLQLLGNQGVYINRLGYKVYNSVVSDNSGAQCFPCLHLMLINSIILPGQSLWQSELLS